MSRVLAFVRPVKPVARTMPPSPTDAEVPGGYSAGDPVGLAMMFYEQREAQANVPAPAP